MAVDDGLKLAVDNRDIVAVKSSFYTMILSDPTFRTSKFDEAFQYVKNSNLDGFIDEHDGEELLPESEWDEDYFDLLASKLLDNFSEERIQQLKKVAAGLDDSKEVKKEEEKKTYSWIIIGVAIIAALIFLKRLLKGGK